MMISKAVPQPIGDSIAYDLNQGNVNLTEIHHQNVSKLMLVDLRAENQGTGTKEQRHTGNRQLKRDA